MNSKVKMPTPISAEEIITGQIRVNGDEQYIEVNQAEAYAQARVNEALEALSHIRQYGSDTLSGRTDGPDDRKWQRDAVLKMTNIAAKAIRALKEGS